MRGVKTLQPEAILEMRRLHAEGWPQHALAKRFFCGETTVFRVVHALGAYADEPAANVAVPGSEEEEARIQASWEKLQVLLAKGGGGTQGKPSLSPEEIEEGNPYLD